MGSRYSQAVLGIFLFITNIYFILLPFLPIISSPPTCAPVISCKYGGGHSLLGEYKKNELSTTTRTVSIVSAMYGGPHFQGSESF